MWYLLGIEITINELFIFLDNRYTTQGIFNAVIVGFKAQNMEYQVKIHNSRLQLLNTPTEEEDTKSYGVPVLFSLLTGPLRSGVVAPDRVLNLCQIELFDSLNSVQKLTYYNWIVNNRTLRPFNCVKTNDSLIELLVIHSNTWNHLAVCKQMNNDE